MHHDSPLVAETPAHWDIKGRDGTNLIDGTSVTFVGYFSGNANGCLNGGAIYAAGNPPVNAYVCNGPQRHERNARRLKDGDCGLTDQSSPGDWRLPTRDERSATSRERSGWAAFLTGPADLPAGKNLTIQWVWPVRGGSR